MKICVAGLSHLGSVTAACLAECGFEVVGWDPSSSRIEALAAGKAPLFEPGLDALLAKGLERQKLSFTSNVQRAVSSRDALWITFDTPVNDKDEADVAYVRRQIISLFKHLKDQTPVIISSQLPVGTSAGLEAIHRPVCYSPENLRLGKALSVFQNPDRIVAGIRAPADRAIFSPILSQVCERIEWMTTESAEMTKHAINSFLATSITFANELAVLCESVGADAREVERGLKTESRIGPRAYLKPGAAFAGGTLARDVQFLTRLARKDKHPASLLNAILQSNQHHMNWVKQVLKKNLRTLKGKKVGILGLSYKEGTDSMQRSWTVELARWLRKQGAHVQAFDWQAQSIAPELSNVMALKASYMDAIGGCDAIVIGTDHSELKKISASTLSDLRVRLLIDPNGVLDRELISSLPSLGYFSVGFSRAPGKKKT